MRAYVAITGIIFALIVVAHIARIMAEGTGLLSDPTIILTSALALCLAVWSAFLLFKRPH